LRSRGAKLISRRKIDYRAPSRLPGEEERQNFDLALANQRTVIDRSNDVVSDHTNLTPGSQRLQSLQSGRIQSESGENKEAIWGAEINAEKQFATERPFKMKTGFRYRGQQTKVDDDRVTSVYVGPDGRQGGDDNLNQFKLLNYSHHGFDGRYTQAVWPDVRAVHGSFVGQRNLWDDDLVATTRDSLSGDGKAREDVYAAT
jgi:hypothetical protein